MDITIKCSGVRCVNCARFRKRFLITFLKCFLKKIVVVVTKIALVVMSIDIFEHTVYN